MARGARGRLRGGGIAGGLGVRKSRAQIRGGRELQGSGGLGKVGGTDNWELGAHGGRIEQGEGCLGVRGHRIRINSQGDVYVLDSEEEEGDMEMEDVVADGAAPVMVATARSPPAAVATDVGLAVDGAPAMEVSVDRDPGMELPPDVQARLEAVLAGIDPLYHDVFVSLYKVMVPAFFKSN